MRNKRITFIGAGNMASAIIGGLSSTDITIYDKDKSKYEKFENKGIGTSASIKDAVREGDIIFLCVKPQNFDEILPELAACQDIQNKVIVSIAAGITIARITDAVGKTVPCVRTMPNTPLMIGKGVTAISYNEHVKESDLRYICRMFSAIGEVFTTEEDQINAITAATSSSPAYVYLFVKSIMDSAVKLGFTNDRMLEIICAMVKGSCDMMLQSGKTPDELIRMVTSPNGTTERAMKVFENEGFSEIIFRAMKDCTERAAELSEGK